jgi:excisionase family DNA binding protein
MEEIFELIKAFNRLRDKIIELSAKIDLITKTPPFPEGDYLNEYFAGKLLNISRSTLMRLRNAKSIPFIKINKKVLYRKTDLTEFLSGKMRGD